MKKMSKILFLFVSLSVLVMHTLSVQAQNKLDKIVAVVNDDIITLSQLQKAEADIKKQYEHKNIPLPPATELRKEVIDHLIDKNLQLQLIKAKNIQVTEEDFNKALSNIAKQNKLDVDKLKDAVTQSGLDYNEFKNHIREQLTFQKLQQQEVARTVTLNDDEVNEYLAKNKQLNQYSSFHLSDVLVPLPENATSTQIITAQKKVKEIITQLRKGQDSPEANDLGWRTFGEVPPLFANQIQNLKIGSVSEAIKAPNGYHILKLIDARGDNIKLTKKDALNIVFQKKMGEAVKKWLAQLRSSAYVKIM